MPRKLHDLVFVYGTLKRGCHNHHVLGGAVLLDEDRTRDPFVMWDLGAYPGITGPNDAGGPVSGEVYRVSPEALATLDAFEGVPHLYRRARLPLASGRTAWAYLYQRPTEGLPKVRGGRWPD